MDEAAHHKQGQHDWAASIRRIERCFRLVAKVRMKVPAASAVEEPSWKLSKESVYVMAGRNYCRKELVGLVEVLPSTMKVGWAVRVGERLVQRLMGPSRSHRVRMQMVAPVRILMAAQVSAVEMVFLLQVAEERRE